MASVEKLIKAFEALKTSQSADSLLDEKQRKKEAATKKDQLTHCNAIAEGLCATNLRTNSEFPKFLDIGLETLLACCNSPDADVRIVADECLNKTIKTLLETNLGRLQVELYKEIKKNGSQRSLRASLWRFADLAHLIRPQKCRPYIVNLLPCIARISKRPEESVQETLAAAVLKIFPVLGKFTNDGEVKALLKSFVGNLKSTSAVCRRTAASSLTAICQHSRKPGHFFAWLLTILLDLATPKTDEEYPNTMLGILLCLRNIVPHLVHSQGDENGQFARSSFGKTAKDINVDKKVTTDQLIQMFDLLLHCTQHRNHNVVTSALDTLQQLLKKPATDFLKVILSPEGIPRSQVLELTQKRLNRSRSGSAASLLPVLGEETEAPLEDDSEESLMRLEISHTDSAVESVSSPCFSVGSENYDEDTSPDHASNKELSLTELCIDPSDYSSMQITLCDDSSSADLETNVTSTDNEQLQDESTTALEDLPLQSDDERSSRGPSPALLSPAAQVDFCVGEIGTLFDQPSLVYCVRHLCRCFLLTGYPGCIIPDRQTRVSIKVQALGCVAAAVALHPAIFFETLFVQDKENIDSMQYIQDICLYANHSDPQLCGQSALLIGSLIKALLNESRGDYLSIHTRTSMQDLTDYMSLIVCKESSVAIRLGLVALRFCLQALLDSVYSELALSLIQQLVKLVKNNYWLVKVELAEILADLDFKTISYLENRKQLFRLSKQVPFRDRVLHEVLLVLLADEDLRVRQAVAAAFVKLVPNLFYETDCPQQDPIVTKARDLTCKFLDPVLHEENIPTITTVHGLAQSYSKLASTPYSAVIESSLSRVVQALMQKLIQSTSKHLTLGCLNVLWLLSENYLVPKFPFAWTCATQPMIHQNGMPHVDNVNFGLVNIQRSLTERDKWMKLNLQDPGVGSSGATLALILNVLGSTPAMLDLTAHQHALLLAGNIFAGAAYRVLRREEDRPDSGNWTMLSDQNLAALADSLLLHLARLLNICSHLIEGHSPGPPQSKPVLPSLPNAPSLSPIKRKSTKKEEKKEVKETSASTSGKSAHDGEKPEGWREKKEEKEKKEKVLLGSVFNLPNYMNLYEVMQGAYGNYKISLDTNASDRFGDMLRAALEVLSTLLEIAGLREVGSHAEELLGYMRSMVTIEPTSTVRTVQQLLKALFGTNLSSQWESNQNQTPSARWPGKVTRLMFTAKPGLYHCCFTAPAAQFTQNILGSGLMSPGQGEESISPGFVGWMKHKLDKKMPSIFKPGNREKAPIADYIRLFEPLVIRALKLYTITSSTELQVQVLDLLAQLVQLRVNYCLLDSDQIFIGFVIKQFEYIEEGQIIKTDKLITRIFHFLVLLSYERYHSKTIIGMPKIIQLCDGLMASGQDPITHAIPALQPIVVDLFAFRGTVNKVDIGKELETQREVVVSMLFRLVHYHQVLDLFSLVLQHCHKDGEDKWKRLSRQIVDVLLPMLANYEINLDDQQALEVLHGLFEVVASSVFRPVDILLTSLLAPPKPLTTVERIQRWMCLVLVILRVLIYQAKEEVVLSRMHELQLYVTVFTDTIGTKEPVSINQRLLLLPEEETLARFLLQVVGIVSHDICRRTGIPSSTQPEDFQFLCQQLSQLLLYITHMFQSGIYRRVATAAMTVIVDNPPDWFYNVVQINSHFQGLKMTHPTLLLQWCNILALLNYENQSWWSEVMQTHALLPSPQQELQAGCGGCHTWSSELVRRGGVILFCDYMCENLNDAERMTWLIVNHVTDLIELSDEPPVQDFISAIHRNSAASGLFIQAIHSRGDNFKTPALVKKTLRCLEAVHHTQSGPLVALLIDKLLGTHHLSIARMCDTVACRRLEMMLTDTPQKFYDQLPLEDLEKLIDAMEQRGMVQRHVRLMSLLSRVREVLSPPAPRTVLPPESSHPLATNTAHIKDINVNKDWLMSIAWEQCCHEAAVPAECAKLLANLEFADQLAIMKANNFNPKVLEASITLGMQKTVGSLHGMQDAISPSEQILPQQQFPDQKEHPLFKSSKVTLLHLVSAALSNQTSFKQMHIPTSGKQSKLISKLERSASQQPGWNTMLHLGSVVTCFLKSHAMLPWQLSLNQESVNDLCRYGILLLEALLQKYNMWGTITAKEMETVLECFSSVLQNNKLFNVFDSSSASDHENVALKVQAVGCVYRIFSNIKNILPDPVLSCATASSQVSILAACDQISELTQWLEGEYSFTKHAESASFPEFIVKPMESIITALGRLSVFTSHARLPPLPKAFGWIPTASDINISPLPTELLQEREVLRQFIFRVNALGFTTRHQFEEIWVTLLAVLSTSQDETGQQEELERVHLNCLVVQGLTTLLMQSMLYPQAGDTVSSCFLHMQRDKPPGFLQTRAGKCLMKVRGVIQVELETLQHCGCCLKNPGELYRKLYNYNLERGGDACVYSLGQVSVESIWSRAGMLDQDSQTASEEEPRAILREADTHIDIHSCLQFLLENLYSLWMKSSTPAHVALLTEAARSVVILSDIFTEQSQFEWMLEVFMNLHKTHPVEDEMLVQYLVAGICKAISVIGLDISLQERVSKLLDQSLRSAHIPTRISAFHGILYILESNQADFSTTVMPLVADSLQKQLACITTGVLHGEKYMLAMLAVAFYILENYQEDLKETEFTSRMLQLFTSVASASEDKTPLILYVSIFHGLERLVLTGAITEVDWSMVVKLAVDRLKIHSPVRALSGLGLLLSIMYSYGRVNLDTWSADGADTGGSVSPVLEIRDSDSLIIAMERLTMLFDRIRKSYPFEAEIVSKILPHFLGDFFPTQDAMNKVIGEFLSSQQPHPQLIAGVLFKVFNKLLQTGQSDLVQDWVMLSLSNFTQRTPIAMATWSLTCFFISASANQWLRALFPHVHSRIGLMETVDRRFFCVAALDFYSQLKDQSQKKAFLVTMNASAQPETPYMDLVSCLQSLDH